LGATEDGIRAARQADRAVEHAIDVEGVRAHLGGLPGREQRILNLRFYGNLTQIEIGQRLGISQMRVSRLLTRALAYLRDQLASEPGRNTPGGLRYIGAR
jgi:RNA polymerase sigma-B factor